MLVKSENPKYVLSVDIGTTNIKASIYYGYESVHQYVHIIESAIDGVFVTQDSKFILKEIEFILKDASSKYPVSDMVLSVPMHTLILLSDTKEPISQMMVWSDRRGASLLDKQSVATKKLVRSITNTQIHSMTPYAKLLWIKEQELDYSYVSDLKSYLIYNLTRNFITDVSSADASGLMDYKTKQWSDTVCAIVDLRVTKLPEIVSINTKVKHKSIDVDIIIGSTDGVMANRGIGADEDEWVLSFGTSIGIRTFSNKYSLSPKYFSYDAGKEQWVNGIASNNGGNLFDYSKNVLDSDLTFDKYVSYLSEPLPKALCIPYVFGERGIWYQENFSVEWSLDNLDNSQKVHTLILALFANLKLMVTSIDSFEKDYIYVTGNTFSNAKMRQFTSNVLNKKLLYVDEENAVCRAGLSLVYESSLPKLDYRLINPQPNSEIDTYLDNVIDYISTYVKSKENLNGKNISED